MVLNKCCFCIDLRNGAIVIATLHMVAALGQLGTTGISWITIVDVILGLIAGAVLLFGAIKYNMVAIIIHLVLALIEIVFLLATAIMIFVSVATWLNLNGGELHWLHTLSLVIGGLISLWAIIEIYFLVCVCSFYQQLKSGMITSPA